MAEVAVAVVVVVVDVACSKDLALVDAADTWV